MVRLILAAPLILHGIAHVSGFMSSWTSNPAGFSKRPWIFSSGLTLSDPLGHAFGLLWLATMASLVGAGLGLSFRQDWWPTLTMVGAVLSLVVILPWWNTVPPGAKFGAAFDLLVIILLILPFKSRILDLVQ
ncbi:MAG TPA: hypothetical protein G4O11_01765 [Anaerolineae bacterium]|nr:hypothetical protein [Anaerolineae bacterium]